VPPVTGRTTLLIEPRVVPFGLAPAGFCLGRLSTTAAWCACASCLGSLGALVCIAWVFVMLHVPSASVRWVFGIPLLVSGLNWCVHPNPGIVSCQSRHGDDHLDSPVHMMLCCCGILSAALACMCFALHCLWFAACLSVRACGVVLLACCGCLHLLACAAFHLHLFPSVGAITISARPRLCLYISLGRALSGV